METKAVCLSLALAWAAAALSGMAANPWCPAKTSEWLPSESAQIPCSYCVYFHTAAAKLNGATDEEIREAVAMSAIVRHWSTVLNGMQVDLAGFKRETDTVLRLAADKSKAAKK
jgi:AhpD family alkylhydroperoxidase